MPKKTVRYEEGTLSLVPFERDGGIRHQAMLRPIDHPNSDLVSNTKYVLTSEVVDCDHDTGIVETQNTIYIPV